MASSRARGAFVAILALGAISLGGLYWWYSTELKQRQGSKGGSRLTAPDAASALARKRVLASVHFVNSRLEEPRHREEILRAVDDARECVRMSKGFNLDRLNLAICLPRQYDDRRFTASEKDSAASEDWVSLATPLLKEARDLIEGVVKERQDLAAAWFHSAMVQARRGKIEAADPNSDWKARLRAAGETYLTLEDRSAAVRYHLGFLLFKDSQYIDAEKFLRRAVAIDPAHPNAYYSLGQAMTRQGDANKRAEATRCFETHRMLQDSVGKQRAQWDPDAVFDYSFPELIAIDSAEAPGVVEGAVRFEERGERKALDLALPFAVGDPAVVAGSLTNAADPRRIVKAALLGFTKGEVRLSVAGAASDWNSLAPVGSPVHAAAAADLDGDHYLDAIVATRDGLKWYRSLGDPSPSSFQAENLPLDGTLDAQPTAIAAADLDADGDIDILTVQSFQHSAQLTALRNDAEPASAAVETPPENLTFRPLFRDATKDSGAGIVLESGVKILLSDFDDHNDTDFCVVGSPTTYVFANRRDFKFDKFAELPGAADGAAGDIDGDGLPDIVLAGPKGLGWSRSEGPKMSEYRELLRGPLDSARVALVDTENRGELDIVTFAKDRVAVLRRQGTGQFADVGPRQFPVKFEGTPLDIAASDLDGDFDLDLVVSRTDDIARIYTNIGGEKSPAIALTFRGTKTNRAGLGAKVELRAGGLRTRREVWTVPFLAGLGRRSRIDGLFLKWTNGIDEAQGDVPSGKYLYLIEKRGREGSCPFVYSWNGKEFVFITDALGATPLGLYAAPGLYVPPQDREWLRIRGDQLVPHEGLLDIRFTEEMRELTYLDRVRLLCVDHPVNTTVYPDERFCFPPFPEKRALRLTEEAPIARATNAKGEDVTELLRQEDRRFVRPPQRLGYQGMGTEHTLELDLGDLTGRSAVRLFLTGWFAWTNSSINRAIAFAGIRFMPPRVDVKRVAPNGPNAGDPWRTVVPDAGFPAGMQKTLCIDLTGKLEPGEHVVRLVTNIELNWDRAFVNFDADSGDAPFAVKITELAPASADLRWRGASRWSLVNGTWPSEPVYADAVNEAVYDLHVGDYTRYGDVLPLLQSNDDQAVIFHHGDEVAISFDARQAPPPAPGWTRTYFLDSSGWAKDMDPNTFAPATVEPLPFHGMGGYPYPADQHYPDTPATRQYRSEWNTRRVQSPRPLPVQAGIEAIHKD